MALTGNAETNILACMTAKKLGVRKTIAMVENLDYVSMAESLDIGTIINKKTIAASHIFQMMLEADVDNLRSLMLVDADVAEFTAAEDILYGSRPYHLVAPTIHCLEIVVRTIDIYALLTRIIWILKNVGLAIGDMLPQGKIGVSDCRQCGADGFLLAGAREGQHGAACSCDGHT